MKTISAVLMIFFQIACSSKRDGQQFSYKNSDAKFIVLDSIYYSERQIINRGLSTYIRDISIHHDTIPTNAITVRLLLAGIADWSTRAYFKITKFDSDSIIKFVYKETTDSWSPKRIGITTQMIRYFPDSKTNYVFDSIITCTKRMEFNNLQLGGAFEKGRGLYYLEVIDHGKHHLISRLGGNPDQPNAKDLDKIIYHFYQLSGRMIPSYVFDSLYNLPSN